MNTLLVFLAPGCEEVEALAVVDIARRAGLDVTTAAVTEGTSEKDLYIESSHNIVIKADMHLGDALKKEYSAVYIPGGMGGSKTIAANAQILDYLKAQKNAYIAAICAGPIVLAAAGLDTGKRGTIYPGMEDEMNYKEHSGAVLVRDGKIITAIGPAAAPIMGLYLVRLLAGDGAYQQVKKGILVPQLLSGLEKGKIYEED